MIIVDFNMPGFATWPSRPSLDVASLTEASFVMLEKRYGHLVADAARERLEVQML